MKKKLIALILAAICTAGSAFCLSACNTNGNSSGEDSGQTEDSSTEVEEKQTYDMSSITFNDKSVIYDGSFHSIEISGTLPQGVSVSYAGGGTNVGEYTVTAKFTGNAVTHKLIADMTAKLTITKAPFTGEISFNGAQFDYDGEAHSIAIAGDLPDGISVAYEYKDEKGEVIAPENVKEVGEYTVTAVFSSENYQPISSLTAVLKIVGQTLYDENGNLNYAVFAETIKNWMNDGYINSKLMIGNFKCTLDSIDYISSKEEPDKIVIGAYVTEMGYVGDSGTKRYRKFKIESEDLLNKIFNIEFENDRDLINYLNTLSGKPIILIGSSINYEKTTKFADGQQKIDLFTMAENILKRLQEVGYQGGSINNEGTKVTDYDGATILSVRKDRDTGGNSSYDMGTVYDTNFYFTIQKANGKKEILSFGVSYSTFGASQNIFDENIGSKSWIIRNYNSKEIDYCPYTENAAQYAFVFVD